MDFLPSAAFGASHLRLRVGGSRWPCAIMAAVSVDPHTTLGVTRDATPQQVSAAYRALAKRWHPDRGGGEDAERRMAEINGAYDLLRSERWVARHERPRAPAPAARAPAPPLPGAWLPGPLRRALGRELLGALERDEAVMLVTPASTWASPQALLAVTDRRLLWLLDDAPTHRVRSLRVRDIEHVELRRRRPLGRSSALLVHTGSGRRLSFAELRPETAAAIAQELRTRAPGAGGAPSSSPTSSATDSTMREAR